MRIEIITSNYTAGELSRVSDALDNTAAIHMRVADDGETFVKDFGRRYAAWPRNHRSSRGLGARPTNHLLQAYKAIEGESSAAYAALLVPRSSRLRAAFGRYVITPQIGRKYLTIPVAAEAYGKRAGEFDDLVFLRVGPRKTPILARPDADGGVTTMYVLIRKAVIDEDQDLIPFEELSEHAKDSVSGYLDDALKASLP